MEALPISRKPHALLRGRMKERDATGHWLSRKMQMSEATFSHKMNGKAAWTIYEVYWLMDYLGIPRERLHDYFPDYRHLKKTIAPHKEQRKYKR